MTAAELDHGWRLGCALTLRRDTAIDVPQPARSGAAKSFGGDDDVDAERVPPVEIDSIAPSGHAVWGAAIDLGTTTLAAALVCLGDGRIGVARSMLNPQAAHGADVIARIHVAGRDQASRERLTAAVRRGIAELVEGMAHELKAPRDEVVSAAVVGNPTMLHLWTGADPSGLGVAPYQGLWTGAVHTRAEEVGLPILAAAPVYVMPCIRSHVGADAVAAAVATGLDASDRAALLIDLGTNSELVLKSPSGTFAASAAAGPAFEGMGISCGMRAGEGAIDALHLEPDGRWSVHVIGGKAPVGLCGSGLFDAVAELLRVGAIDEGGYLRTGSELGAGVGDALANRIEVRNARRAVTLVEREGAAPIALEATDIRQIQLASGAIRAAIEILCGEARVAPADLASVFVAGAFGGFVRKRSLIRLGMLPGVAAERVRAVGNAAGLGARLALLDRRVRDRAERLASLTAYVELAGRADYAEALTRSLRFPGAAAGRA